MNLWDQHICVFARANYSNAWQTLMWFPVKQQPTKRALKEREKKYHKFNFLFYKVQINFKKKKKHIYLHTYFDAVFRYILKCAFRAKKRWKCIVPQSKNNLIKQSVLKLAVHLALHFSYPKNLILFCFFCNFVLRRKLIL